jgi:hypothetical protein
MTSLGGQTRRALVAPPATGSTQAAFQASTGFEFGGYPDWHMMIAGEMYDLCKVGMDMTRWEADSL